MLQDQLVGLTHVRRGPRKHAIVEVPHVEVKAGDLGKDLFDELLDDEGDQQLFFFFFFF